MTRNPLKNTNLLIGINVALLEQKISISFVCFTYGKNIVTPTLNNNVSLEL